MIIGADRTGSTVRCRAVVPFSTQKTLHPDLASSGQGKICICLSSRFWCCIPVFMNLLFMNALHLPCPPPPPHTLSYYFPHVLSMSSITRDLSFLFSISPDGAPGGVCGQLSPHVSIFRTKYSLDVSSSDAVSVSYPYGIIHVSTWNRHRVARFSNIVQRTLGKEMGIGVCVRLYILRLLLSFCCIMLPRCRLTY